MKNKIKLFVAIVAMAAIVGCRKTRFCTCAVKEYGQITRKYTVTVYNSTRPEGYRACESLNYDSLNKQQTCVIKE